MTIQDAFLAELDPIWAPKSPLKGAQDEPKTDPRRVKNRVQNRNPEKIEKWTARDPMTGIELHTLGPQMPVGG